MAEQEELRHMVLSFRVSELQVLLGFAGRNKTGRKDQLQQRALDLLKLRSAPIQMKIKELYKRYPSTVRSSKPSSDSETSNNSSNSIPEVVPSSQQMQQQAKSSSNQYVSHLLSQRPIAPNPSHISTPLDFSSKYSIITSQPSNYPVHPDVKFKKLPFYDVQAELLKPASLVPTGTSRFQEANFIFHFTPQQAQDIAMSRDLRSGAKMESTVQCQMRFCLLETSCEQDDNFPPSICAKVNGKICPLPNPIPTNKPGVEPKRPSRPVNITCFCKLSPTVPNQINVSWASEYGRGYAISVYLVKKLTSANLLHRLRSQGVRNADHTRALIKEKLAHDADSEIATTSLRVSLMCPLGKMRMQIPCRASTCTHLQCFDASLYIQMNEKKPTWICPVCDKGATFDSLIIDGLFMEIFNLTTDCNEIQFHDDGSWSPLIPKKETHVIESPVVQKSSASSTSSTVSLSSGSSSNSSSSSSSSSSSISTISSNVAQKKAGSKFEVIDLISDSSDDDEPPKKSPAPPYSSSISNPHHSVSGIPLPPSSHPSGNYTTTSGSGILSQTSSSNSSSSISISRLNSLPRGASSPAYRDMPILDSSQIFYPPVSSPFPDFLQPSHPPLYNFPGYELFNMLGQNELDRQVSQYGLSSSMPSSSGTSVSIINSHKLTQPPASPDIISLD